MFFINQNLATRDGSTHTINVYVDENILSRFEF